MAPLASYQRVGGSRRTCRLTLRCSSRRSPGRPGSSAATVVRDRRRSWTTPQLSWSVRRHSGGFVEAAWGPASARGGRAVASDHGLPRAITIEPGKRGGKPCLRGLRITVYDVLDYLAGGMDEDAILADFPDLEREDIRAALAFAADRERRLAGDVAA